MPENGFAPVVRALTKLHKSIQINITKKAHCITAVLYPRANNACTASHRKNSKDKTVIQIPTNVIRIAIYAFMIPPLLGKGASFIYICDGASVAKASDPKVSMIILIHNICKTVIGVSMPSRGQIAVIATALRLVVI